LRIATQARPRLFDRRIVLPEMLYERVIEARERVRAHGEAVQALDVPALTAQMQRAFDDGIRSCAIVFFMATATSITNWLRPVLPARSDLRRFPCLTASAR